MVSGSDRHASTWQHTFDIPGAKDLMLNHAYKAMAWLGEAIEGEDSGQARHSTDAIEEALYEHRKSLFGAISVAFFDTTSLYFEGDGGATLGQLGHSKDFRPQLKQVVLGIVLDEQDRPIASFLWPGNTADVTTLLPVVERLRSRFGVERACIVADRGMISAATIAALEARKIDYILGARERSSKEVRETVLHDDGATVPLTIPRQKGETDLAVREIKVEGRRYIVCRKASQPGLLVCGFGILDQVGDQRFGQFGRVILRCRFQRMEQRRHGCRSARFLKGGNRGWFARTCDPRQPLQARRRNAFWWRWTQIERPNGFEPVQLMQEFAGRSLCRHGSQSIQRGKTGLAGFIEQLANPLTLFLIKGRNKTFPKTLLRAVPDAADKAFKDAHARQQHLVDDQQEAARSIRGPG